MKKRGHKLPPSNPVDFTYRIKCVGGVFVKRVLTVLVMGALLAALSASVAMADQKPIIVPVSRVMDQKPIVVPW